MPRITRRLPTRWQRALGTRAALSSTAALDNAAAAWHVTPCITRRMPTRWQHALGTRAALTLAQLLHSIMQPRHGIFSMAGDAMHCSTAAHKVAACARHSCRAWVVLRRKSMAARTAAASRGTWMVAACARRWLPRLAQQLHSMVQLQHSITCHALLDARYAMHHSTAAHGCTHDGGIVWRRHALLDGCPQGGSVRSTMAASLSSTAALDGAASAWHELPA